MFNLQRAASALEVYSHERINVQAVTVFIHSLRRSLGSEQQRLGVVLTAAPTRRRGEENSFIILSHHNVEDVQRQIAAVQTVQH